MANLPAGNDDEGSERSRIRKSMRRWREMDAPARLLGRGLGMKELVDRVAREVGTTLRQVHSALKGAPR
ncbi:MAG: hypothetical protein HY928_12160 [Elusimicrobia bacterium]|nr:hypothetical protein [Elusimicrobiota bacterium]